MHHGNKSNKETQSPLLNIFKDIMMRENNNDPEKRNLIDQEKKRKAYLGSRVKGNRRACDSSSSEHRKRSPYKTLTSEQRVCPIAPEEQSAYHGEGKSRWWRHMSTCNFCKEPFVSCTCKAGNPIVKTTTKDDDTCSCVSCALKRIIGSEYACIACLVVLLSISIVSAVCLVYKNVPSPCASSPTKLVKTSFKPASELFKTPPPVSLTDSERLKRKIDGINDDSIKNKNELSEEGVFGKPHYDDLRADSMDMTGSSEIDFGPSLRELNVLDSKTSLNGDLEFPSLSDSAMSNDSGNEKLKEFYKKLVQTDGMIKNLRRMKFNQNNDFDADFGNKATDRYKRSLHFGVSPKKYRLLKRRRNINKRSSNIYNDLLAMNKPVLKPLGNDTRQPTGFVLEKKKLLVKYKPGNLRKLVPKCSHVPKESQHHEHELKHPFYQNTQRLDELLDKFLNKNLPEIVSDPFGFDSLFQGQKPKCKHPPAVKDIDNIRPPVDYTPKTFKNSHFKIVKPFKLDKTKTLQSTTAIPSTRASTTHKFKTKPETSNFLKTTTHLVPKNKPYIFSTPDRFKILEPDTSTVSYERKFYNHEVDMIKQMDTSILTNGPSDFELLLSVSTIMNPNIEDVTEPSKPEPLLIDRVPNIRRLMQVEGEEEETLGYEELKEVLTDHMENEDEIERREERKKRMYDVEIDTAETTELPSSYRLYRNEMYLPAEISLSHEGFAISAETSPFPIEKDDYQKLLQSLNPPDAVNNPNWKGAMPLYPDELSSMIKMKSEINKVYKIEPEKDTKSASGLRKKRSDLEYVKNYLDNKFSEDYLDNKLVKMAQAYSDYGVLEGKKDNVRNDKHPASNNKISEERVKMSAEEMRQRNNLASDDYYINPPFGFPGKHSSSSSTTTGSDGMLRLGPLDNTISKSEAEGFKFEVRSDPGHTHIDESIIPNILNFKIDGLPNIGEETTLPEYNPILAYPQMYDPKSKVTDMEEERNKGLSPGGNSVFTMNKKRALLSTAFGNFDNSPIIDTHVKENDEKYILSDIQLDYSADNKTPRAINIRKIFKTKFKNQQNTNKFKSYYNYDNTDLVSNAIDGNTGFIYNPIAQQIVDYVSHATERNVKLFSAPYLYPITPAKLTKSPSLMFYRNTNFTNETIEHIIADTEQKYNEILNNNLNTNDKERSYEFATDTNEVRQRETSQKLIHILPTEKKTKPPNSTLIIGGFNDRPNISLDSLYAKGKRRFKRDIESTETMVDIIADTTPNNNLSKDLNMNVKYNISVTHINTKARDTNTPANNTSNNSISDFFMMVSNWFKALDGIQVDDKRKVDPGTDLTQLLLLFNERANDNNSKHSTTTIPAYPLYDSDMIDNIGHRSRVILSVKEDNTIESAGRTGVDKDEVIDVKNSNVTRTVLGSNTSTVSIDLFKNQTTAKPQDQGNETTTVNLQNTNGNNRKVKRNADDSSLISWNDIYDDEYGIQTETVNNVVRDRYSKERALIQRSGRWVHDKFKKITDNFKNYEPDSLVKKRTSRDVKNVGLLQKLKDYYVKTKKQDDYRADSKTNFKALRANMIDVCKKTANAVKRTRNADVTKAGEESNLATTLMQQLVRLLTDVVEFQVEQKTCSQLPPDLKQFLVWLTKPEEGIREEKYAATLIDYNPESLLYKNNPMYSGDTLEDFMRDDRPGDVSSTTEEPPPVFTEADYRAQYQNAIRDVQELLEEYDEMSDEDKSKMTGVKFYMQNQLEFLNKQLNSYEFINLYDKTSPPIKYKRSFPKKSSQRFKRKNCKFVRNYGKKHTRSTAGFYEDVTLSRQNIDTDIRIELNNIKDNNEKIKDLNRKERNLKEIFYKAVTEANIKHHDRTERNLKDIYYKAVAEAKKYSSSITKSRHMTDKELAEYRRTSPLSYS